MSSDINTEKILFDKPVLEIKFKIWSFIKICLFPFPNYNNKNYLYDHSLQNLSQLKPTVYYTSYLEMLPLEKDKLKTKNKQNQTKETPPQTIQAKKPQNPTHKNPKQTENPKTE